MREMEFARKERGSAIARAEEVMENLRDITRLLRFRKKKANDIGERRMQALHSPVRKSYAPSDTLMFRKYRYALGINKAWYEFSSTGCSVRFIESFSSKSFPIYYLLKKLISYYLRNNVFPLVEGVFHFRRYCDNLSYFFNNSYSGKKNYEKVLSSLCYTHSPSNLLLNKDLSIIKQREMQYEN